ncbi:hypothetical protein GH714_034542 [Hevea brasiliensis]|uniref:SANT domain-containing protein n=1 Tax=Hevea brasiliensis TaxID=3981 RepID=A0A6A6L6E6_HEVBR|nr:hypothetical protein GH714_034542 [Hevea brasiliensis]
MPQERLSWDRKEFLKERKYDRPKARWRESSSSHYGSYRDFARWGGSNEFRRPPGSYLSYHWVFGTCLLKNLDMGTPFRSSDRILEEKNFRPSVSRGDGKHGRNGRDNRGSFGQRDWKAHSWEMSNGSPNTPGRPHDASQRGDRENSLDWKPLNKWTRSGSLSSRGSGFSHSSSSKSLGGADSCEGKAELQHKNASLVQSPSGDAAACVTSVPSEEMAARKKPRLNWGEGLAKYEKKKVEGPEVNVSKDGVVISSSNIEPIHSQSSNLVDKSPRAMGLSDCASPATPSSVTCSSPLVEEKTFGKGINADNDVSNLCGSPCVGSQSHIEGFSFNLDVLNATSIANLGSALVELLQSDDSSSVDSSFVKSTALNKLLIWKGGISKALEVTESEIDLLENELKSLKFETGSRCPCPAAASCFLAGDESKLCSEQAASSNDIPRLLHCKFHLVGLGMSRRFLFVMASWKLFMVDECSDDMGVIQTPNMVLKSVVPCSNRQDIDEPAHRDVNLLTESKEEVANVAFWQNDPLVKERWKFSLVTTTEMLNFTSKVLQVSQVEQYRNALKMPALILDKKERMVSRFISRNGLIEDPCVVEKERAMINPWTSEEREIFMDKLATFGKDFRKIASFSITRQLQIVLNSTTKTTNLIVLRKPKRVSKQSPLLTT